MDDPRSYSLYMTDLGLIGKYPYSASANPDLHLFLHIIGVSIVGTQETTGIIPNGTIAPYVLGHYREYQIQFIADGELSDEVEVEAGDRPPRNADLIELFRNMRPYVET